MSPKELDVYTGFCRRVRETGRTLTEAFRLWFYQYHTLRLRGIRLDDLERLCLRVARGWIEALAGTSGFGADDSGTRWRRIVELSGDPPLVPAFERFSRALPGDETFSGIESVLAACAARGVPSAWLVRLRNTDVNPAQWTEAVAEFDALLRRRHAERQAVSMRTYQPVKIKEILDPLRRGRLEIRE